MHNTGKIKSPSLYRGWYTDDDLIIVHTPIGQNGIVNLQGILRFYIALQHKCKKRLHKNVNMHNVTLTQGREVDKSLCELRRNSFQPLNVNINFGGTF